MGGPKEKQAAHSERMEVVMANKRGFLFAGTYYNATLWYVKSFFHEKREGLERY